MRAELDDELGRLRKDVDDATMVRVDLERKIETLKEELEYGKKMHNEVSLTLITAAAVKFNQARCWTGNWSCILLLVA